MRFISCKKCGARVSNQYSYCTNCQAPFNPKDLEETEYSAIQPKLRSPLAGWLLSPVEAKRGTKYKPTDTRQGALVGAFIGFISGVYAATIAYFIILRFIWPALTATMIQSLGMTLPTLWNILIAAVVIAVPITSVVMGTLFGVLFIVFRERLAGRTTIRKSVAFSLILCLISFLIGLRSYISPSRTSILNNATLASLRSLQVLGWALSPVEFTLLGYLFGYLLNRRLKPR
ncbi:MAG: hypothetical protein WB661_02180 [Candidatus Bathyarchaeia archaeon]